MEHQISAFHIHKKSMSTNNLPNLASKENSDSKKDHDMEMSNEAKMRL